MKGDPEEAIYTWYAKSQVDYAEYYLKLYVAYNAWYGKVTGSENDRRALSLLKKRFVIWRDYLRGETMHTLRIYMHHIEKSLKENPLPTHRYWKGAISGFDDWQNLIEYWYQVRCLLVHSGYVPDCHARLAYHTLYCFMSEIVRRMKESFTETDTRKFSELTTLLSRSGGVDVPLLQREQHLLQRRFLNSPDIWEVDMHSSPYKPLY